MFRLLFIITLIAGIIPFVINTKKLIRSIRLGKDINRYDNPKERWGMMARVALGQGKMGVRPVSAVLHFIVYIGFFLINIELIEILIDGICGTHRFFSFLGGFYNFLTASLEIMAVLVIIAVCAFWFRRNILKINRFQQHELDGFPRKDANTILYIELVLMVLFLLYNISDYQNRFYAEYSFTGKGTTQFLVGNFPVSQYLSSFLPPIFSVYIFKPTFFYLHFVGILFFMNYLYYSKHLHIMLAFPNTYFAKLTPKGQLDNLESVTREVKLMLDPNADPYAVPAEDVPTEKFGAEDVMDLNWVQLMNAYSCTECGRCTDVCPANKTGKKLSPRKIMMATRDRLEEVSKNIDTNKEFQPDGKTLLNDYITAEEIWACTTCNACTEACPILIDPLSIIIDLRRFSVMEQSKAPQELNAMMTTIENNGAPWQFSPSDRLNWAKK